jgi:AraC-like DNA-binding protein
VNYFEISPGYLLAPFIKTYWFLEGNLPAYAIQPERVFPDGCTELIIHYGEAFEKITGSTTEKQANSFVFGQLEAYIELLPSTATGVMGVRFYPNGLSHFTKVPLNEFGQQSIELHHLFNKESIHLASRIAECPTATKKAEVIEQFLLQHLDSSKTENVIAHIVKNIYRVNGSVSINDLVKQYYLSERQLERKFAQQVGLSPKTFSRIIRFQQVFSLAINATSLTSLALEAGYFDQAHFVREFKSFTGYSPKQYFSGQPGLSSFFLDD